jgi:hypothetical protein
MKFKINSAMFKTLADVLCLAVFQSGFKVLGKQSPFESTLKFKRPEIMRTTGVIWLMPKGVTNKSMAIATLASDGNYIQFDCGHRKFDQLAAFEVLLKLGVLEVSDASDDSGVF